MLLQHDPLWISRFCTAYRLVVVVVVVVVVVLWFSGFCGYKASYTNNSAYRLVVVVVVVVVLLLLLLLLLLLWLFVSRLPSCRGFETVRFVRAEGISCTTQ